MLLENRHEAVEQKLSPLSESIAWKVWKRASLNRKMMNMGNGKLKNWMVNKVFKGWNNKRGDLSFSKKTFNEMWRQQRGKN